MAFGDETGFTRHPRRARGRAKRGQRLRLPTTSDHHQRLNLFGWVAPTLGRRGLLRRPAGNRAGFLGLCRHLCQRLRGYRVTLYVDRAAWHRGDAVRAFLATHRQLCLEYLPPYQPALNVQERCWRQLRYEATANRWFPDLEATWATIRTTLRHWSPQKVQRLCNIS